MRRSINTSKWYDPMWAAFMFFTRIPLWKIYQPSKESFTRVVEYWPLTGWFTGGIMASVLYFMQIFFPFYMAIIIALSTRVILTGALHEDGLADFFDAFGGEYNNKERILEIMKDSRIGTYGVLSLILYHALLFATLYSIGPFYAPFAIMATDPFCKMIAGQITQILPYARSQEESKGQICYRKFTTLAAVLYFIQGIIPFIIFIYLTEFDAWDFLVIAPCFTMFFSYLYLSKKIQGYTGDCCGAIFLLSEISMYVSIAYCL